MTEKDFEHRNIDKVIDIFSKLVYSLSPWGYHRIKLVVYKKGQQDKPFCEHRGSSKIETAQEVWNNTVLQLNSASSELQAHGVMFRFEMNAKPKWAENSLIVTNDTAHDR